MIETLIGVLLGVVIVMLVILGGMLIEVRNLYSKTSRAIEERLNDE